MFWVLLLFTLFGLLFLLARVHFSLHVWLGLLLCAGVMLWLAGMHGAVVTLVLGLIAAVFIMFGMQEVRKKWVSKPLKAYISRSLPPMSDTERDAIEAGSVWWDAELFQGDPDWSKLLDMPSPTLSEAEQAFLDGSTDVLCGMLDDWQISHELHDLSPEVWAFIKQHGFFGMIIPTDYGGLGFGAYAHACVIQKIASRSSAAAVTVMVPNSLGPAELLMAYGTEMQKNYYLPRLASGEDVPCFALTAPTAGSDAGAIPDAGIVCKSEFEGKEILGLLLNWDKRYITLGPVATVIGLAFHVYDPAHLLGEDDDLGITCALIPATTPGVEIGRRHDPLNIAFQNGPNSGVNVFIPMDWVIGGQAMIGKGWRMLVERLSIGRGISLPALSTAAGKMASDTTGAYACLRKQFNTSIGRFEGVEEALARMGGLTYMMDATLKLTTSALDAGEKPAVLTAISKRYLTEAMRQVINDAMDVHGGRGICMGSANYLGRTYQSIPVAITVEGANILTRSMIIFGQGALRCHPYLQEEIAAAGLAGSEGLERFDQALMGHLHYNMANVARSLLYGLSAAYLAPSPVAGETARYFRQVARLSAATSAMADVALLSLGGALKRKESISGRFADALAYLYLCSATLKRFEDDGRPKADLPLLHWVCQYSLYQVQQALDGVIDNFPLRWVAWKMRVWVFPLGCSLKLPNDRLQHKVAALLIEPSATRDRLVDGVYRPDDKDDLTGRLHHAMLMTIRSESIERKLRQLNKKHRSDQSYEIWLETLVQDQTLEQQEADMLLETRQAVMAAIRVDDFPAGTWGRN